MVCGGYGGLSMSLVEFAERRSDWLLVRNKVEGKVRGDQCVVM